MARQIGVLKRAAQTENNPRALVKIFTSKTAIRVLGEDSKLYRIIKMVYRARSASRREQGTLGQQVCTERARFHVRVHCGIFLTYEMKTTKWCTPGEWKLVSVRKMTRRPVWSFTRLERMRARKSECKRACNGSMLARQDGNDAAAKIMTAILKNHKT